MAFLTSSKSCSAKKNKKHEPGGSKHGPTQVLLKKRLESFHVVVVPSLLLLARAHLSLLGDAWMLVTSRKNPAQLSCHVRLVSPLTVSLCPDRVCAICSTALISLLPKMRAFVAISPEIPQASTPRPLHTHTHTHTHTHWLYKRAMNIYQGREEVRLRNGLNLFSSSFFGLLCHGGQQRKRKGLKCHSAVIIDNNASASVDQI